MATHPYTRLFPDKTVIPTSDDDSIAGYEVGDWWIRTNGQIYQCIDASEGAAVWIWHDFYTTEQIDGMFDGLFGVFAPLGAVKLSSASPRVYTAGATWTKPSNLAYIIVDVQAPGGGGGGVEGVAGQAACANSGGGGTWKRKKILAADLGSSETVTIGAVGTGATAGANNGATGGTTSFGSHVSCVGGTGGNGQASQTSFPTPGTVSGGIGGDLTGALGDINIPGGAAIPGICWSATSVQQSIGGASHLGLQTKSSSALTTDEAGITGNQYGAGGTGAKTSSAATNRAGGDGGPGVVVVWEYLTA